MYAFMTYGVWLACDVATQSKLQPSTETVASRTRSVKQCCGRNWAAFASAKAVEDVSQMLICLRHHYNVCINTVLSHHVLQWNDTLQSVRPCDAYLQLDLGGLTLLLQLN